MLNRPYLLPFLAALVFLLGSCLKENSATSKPGNNAETKAATLTAVTQNISNNTGGLYQALPAGYEATGMPYPLLVSLHGVEAIGNGGTDLPKLLDNGLPALLSRHQLPGSFPSGGNNYSFIVVSPQFKSWPSPEDINAVISFAVSHYRVDTSRIYLLGQSMGGGAAWDYAAVFGRRIAAMVTVSGASWLSGEQGSSIAASGLPLWAFHNRGDSTIDVSTTTGNINAVNSSHPAVSAAMTLWAATGHDAWTKATNPATRDCNGMNIYEWLLQHHR